MSDGGFDEILAQLFSKEVANKLYQELTTTFDKFDYLVTRREFTVIFLDDVLRHLQHLGDSKGVNKITNPSTGNVFNLIARDGELVAGIRFWLSEFHDTTSIRFRFRIASIQEDKEETTTRIKLVCDEAITNLADVGLYIDMTEPPEVNKEPELLKITEE
jgi:hypothetical protein